MSSPRAMASLKATAMATRPFWSEYRILAWEPTTCGEKGGAQETRPPDAGRQSLESGPPRPARVPSAVWGCLVQMSLLTGHRRASRRGPRLTGRLLGGDLLCVSVRPRPHFHLLPHPPQAQVFNSSGDRCGHLRHWVVGMRGSVEKHTCNHWYRQRRQSGWVRLDWEAQDGGHRLGQARLNHRPRTHWCRRGSVQPSEPNARPLFGLGASGQLPPQACALAGPSASQLSPPRLSPT